MRKILGLCALLSLTWCLAVAHLGVLIPPPLRPVPQKVTQPSRWIPRHEKGGLQHAVLIGDPYTRGLAWGAFTKSLLEREEEELVNRLQGFFPSAPVRLALLLAAKRWFWGIDRYLDDEWLQEMHGVSQSAPEKFGYLADPYTRQVALHGLHEVGQMFVDYAPGDYGCTVLAYPQKNGWLVGRNFDFEGGRIFDEEKILKWVFPDNGIPFVSVIWAGMVGAVTGVNAKGVYVSINAAGSADFGRLGTPSTLIITKALQHAKTAEAAIEIFRAHKTIITEIFVVTAPGAPLYVIEKSPQRMFVAAHREPTAVANHLLDPGWKDDKINEFRMRELTTIPRYERARAILAEIAEIDRAEPANFKYYGPQRILDGLRDKRVPGSDALQLGHRKAIDALIATHAVVYDAEQFVLHVGVGPSLTGEFVNFNLEKSFEAREPMGFDAPMRADGPVSPERYAVVKAQQDLYMRTLARKDLSCEAAKTLEAAVAKGEPHYLKSMATAALKEACGTKNEARAHWETALKQNPAYAKERQRAEAGVK